MPKTRRSRRYGRRHLFLASLGALALVVLTGFVMAATMLANRLQTHSVWASYETQHYLDRLAPEFDGLIDATYGIGMNDPLSKELAKKQFHALSDNVRALQAHLEHEPASDAAFINANLAALSKGLNDVAPVFATQDQALVDAAPELLKSLTTLTTHVQLLTKFGQNSAAQARAVEHDILTSQFKTLVVFGLLTFLIFMALLVVVWQLYSKNRRRAVASQNMLNRLSTMLNTSSDAILVINSEGEIVDFNAAARKSFGITHEHQPKANIKDILYRDNGTDNPGITTGQMLVAACQSGPKRCTRMQAKDRDGRIFPVEMSASLARQNDREVCICYLRDISQRLAAQSELEAARDRAMESEQTQARFLGMISHEMRTPLNGILGALDLFNDTSLSHEQKHYTNIIQSAGQQLLTQINDALDFAQEGVSEVALNVNPFDLDDLLREAVAGQSTLAEAQGTTLDLQINDGPLGQVNGDQSRVLQVLVNLVSNAVKFTPNGQVTVEATRSGETADWIEIQVADTGVGIAEADLPHIFDDFVRVGKDTGLNTKGTGLGLGIARQLTKAMNGEIGAESILGEGSLFWVRLPLPKASDADAHAATTKDAKPQTPQKPLDILVVEDNGINRFVICEMLRKDGHRTEEAPDGQVAEQRAETQHFDLILMDIRMPGRDGIETARRIRKSKGRSSKARIIFLTAHILEDKAPWLSEVGAEAFLAKPLRRADLRDVIAGTPDTALVKPKNVNAPLDQLVLNQLRATLPLPQFADLLTRFQLEGDVFMQDLEALFSMERNAAIARLHHFAGSAATFGAVGLQIQLLEVEEHIRTGDHTLAHQAAHLLPDIWSSTCAALKTQHLAA